MDRTFWRVIANDEKALPQGEWVAELAPELLSWLGSTDAELRDEFAYRILAAWIERDQFGPDQLRELISQMVDNLQIGLGQRDGDSVFLRSYSALVLMEIVAHDNVHSFLRREEVARLLHAALDYLRQECDLRGWVEGPGWAHAVAHTADLLMMLARNLQLGGAELRRLLDGVADRLLQPCGVVLVQHEDERLAYAVLNVLRRGLVEREFLEGWLARFTHPTGRDSWRLVHALEGESAARVNVTSFLRSLYFQLILTENPPPDASQHLAAVLATLQSMDIGFYALG
ncbi:MAG TPA: DUF2785 domain-containing protein [Actinomycetes bacterium]|nr:DUF2785 domain-containing protein [Actinomycetes bacterium]